MVDPLAEVVTLLQPTAKYSKLVEAAGTWRIQGASAGEPFYGAVLEGSCRMTVDGGAAMVLHAGDFVLVPALRDLVNASLDASDTHPISRPLALGANHFWLGRRNAPATVRMRVGHCSFGSPDAALLISLLPQVVLVRSEPRLTALVQMVGEETRARRPARELVLERLLEVLLIEALRCGAGAATTPGLARGLADERIGAALRALHARPDHGWTVVELAAQAALSRSAFFARFSQIVGVAPMAYLLAWRMALAKRLLRGRELDIEQIADRIGYASGSTFSVAFSRHVGMSPMRYARTGRSKTEEAVMPFEAQV